MRDEPSHFCPRANRGSKRLKKKASTWPGRERRLPRGTAGALPRRGAAGEGSGGWEMFRMADSDVEFRWAPAGGRGKRPERARGQKVVARPIV
ncbi:hypothetical protein AVXHC19_34960 [Acidovorax sacchari]